MTRSLSDDNAQDDFERLHWQIRCAVPPLEPARLRLWLHIGMKLARRRGIGAGALHRRMLANLLATAHDCALPMAWRSACVGHVAVPLALLDAVQRPREPGKPRDLDRAVDAARRAVTVAGGSALPS